MLTTSGKRPPSPVFDTAPPKKSRLFAPQYDEDKPQNAAKVDLTYGQRGAFPGLGDDGGGGQQLFYGPADDGLAYLRMVRLEAKGVPNLLVAPVATKLPQEKDIYAPYEPRGEGFYSDGAYVAIPSAGVMDEQYEELELDPQEAYYKALLKRFEILRCTLSMPPPSPTPHIDPAIRSLLGKPKASPWKHALLKSRPTPNLLCRLPNENAIFGMEVLESLLTIKNLKGGVRHRLGVWAWGLLGRCRDVSEMDSEDVSVLRGLGKKACALLRRLRAGEELDGAEDNSDDNTGENDTRGSYTEYGKTDAIDDGEVGEKADSHDDKIPESALADEHTRFTETSGDNATNDSHTEETFLEETRTRLLAGLFGADHAPLGDSGDPQIEQTSAEPVQISDAQATLDMIVTLVGECYGQRDLLDARLAWEEL